MVACGLQGRGLAEGGAASHVTEVCDAGLEGVVAVGDHVVVGQVVGGEHGGRVEGAAHGCHRAVLSVVVAVAVGAVPGWARGASRECK